MFRKKFGLDLSKRKMDDKLQCITWRNSLAQEKLF